ncbi:MAG: rod-binding protein [Desulfobacterales bacterium]|nr:rod-binding protein [Desulfobacterales bacterium]
MDTITNIHTESGISPTSAAQNARLKKSCADFESIFIYYMFKSMRKSTPQNGVFGNTHGSEIYKSMTDQAMSDHIARGRGMGLGELLYNQLKRSTK